jgi:hypothetical protein
MKKLLLKSIITAGLFLIFVLLLNTAAAAEKQGIIKAKAAEQIIKEKSEKVIGLIAARDFKELADYVHPEKGLRFTPYTHVRPEKDINLTKEQVSNFFKINKKYLWGYYDGSGKEIRLTPKEYYYQFIYTNDFINADKIGYNKVLSSGNMIENQFEVYEKPIIVEYYFPGFKAKFGGMDWKSLRLVFEKYKDNWKLRGIIHNQWTI